MLKIASMKILEGKLHSIDVISREDLDGSNHLIRNDRRMLNLSFDAVSALVEMRDELKCLIGRNRLTFLEARWNKHEC